MIFLGIGSSLKSKFGDRYANIKKTINLISESRCYKYPKPFFNQNLTNCDHNLSKKTI